MYAYPDEQTGYEYEVPENPLTLPTKKPTAPTGTTATTTTATLVATSGYQLNVPDNPLTLPPRKDTTTLKVPEGK